MIPKTTFTFVVKNSDDNSVKHRHVMNDDDSEHYPPSPESRYKQRRQRARHVHIGLTRAQLESDVFWNEFLSNLERSRSAPPPPPAESVHNEQRQPSPPDDESSQMNDDAQSPPPVVDEYVVFVLSCVSPFVLFNVTSSSPLSDMRHAFRKVALRIHPDKCRAEDAHSAFQHASSLYEKMVKQCHPEACI